MNAEIYDKIMAQNFTATYLKNVELTLIKLMTSEMITPETTVNEIFSLTNSYFDECSKRVKCKNNTNESC